MLILSVDGSVDVADFQAQHLLADEGTYHRLQPTLNQEVALDDVDKLDLLCDFADGVNLQPTVEWLSRQVGSITS